MIDVTLEYDDLKINIEDIENIGKSKNKTIDDKIDEAIKNFDDQIGKKYDRL